MKKRIASSLNENKIKKNKWTSPFLKKYPKIVTESGTKNGNENKGNVNGNNSNEN